MSMRVIEFFGKTGWGFEVPERGEAADGFASRDEMLATVAEAYPDECIVMERADGSKVPNPFAILSVPRVSE